jgi:hypothetical protein
METAILQDTFSQNGRIIGHSEIRGSSAAAYAIQVAYNRPRPAAYNIRHNRERSFVNIGKQVYILFEDAFLLRRNRDFFGPSQDDIANPAFIHIPQQGGDIGDFQTYGFVPGLSPFSKKQIFPDKAK